MSGWVHVAAAARDLIVRAEGDIGAAIAQLRDAGAVESADALMVERKRLRIWTQRGGFLDCLAAED